MDRIKEIERSIITTYRKTIWRPFCKALMNYGLIVEGDHIMVCISGGKDSFLLAKCIQEVQRHGPVQFEAEYVVMDPGYAQKIRQKIHENAELLGIPIQVFETNIFAVAEHISEKHPCYMCARMRRGALYTQAQKLGCNKIALGHHFNDVIETTLMSMFYGAEVRTMMPKVHSEHFEGLELIRPLYLVHEDAIINWMHHADVSFLNCACAFTERNANTDETTSKRKEMKELIKELKKKDPIIDEHLFLSMTNVNLNCILGTVKDGEHHSFMETYDTMKKK